MKRCGNILITIVVFLLLTGGCTQQPPEDSTSNLTPLELTLEELLAYNGKEGNPAYVAVDGIIYDVSGSKKWRNGEHNGHTAGQNLTDVIKNKSPHGVSILSRMPVVGKIVE
ncbi:MAG: cytochrome b5 domain-containing protein [Dehalobacterium sp.]|jgi:predicted heme/steroid binding protein